MALQGDGNGVVTIPNFQSFGVFSVTGKAIYKNALQMVLGFNGGGSTYLACFSGGVVKAITSGTANTLQLSGFTDGDVLTYTWARDVNDLVTFTVNGTSTASTAPGAMNIDSLGQYNGGQLKYSGEWQDDLVMTGDVGGNDRAYNFNQSSGSLVLPDTTSSQDGTLSGFTTGGFVGGAGNNISITSVSDYECIQRDTNGQALFLIAGNCSGATAIEYKLDSDAWLVLDASPTTTFSGSVLITGQQNITVRLSNDTPITDSVNYLSATLSVSFWWQSNMAGRLTNNQTYTVGAGKPVPIEYNAGAFGALTDPTGTDGSSTGSILPLLAQKYLDAGIPVCFSNVAIGGTSINMWEISGGNYAKITAFAAALGGIEYTLSIGGETDTINGMIQSEMESKLDAIVNAIQSDFGVNHKLVYFPIGDTLGGDTSIVRSAFDSVISSNSFCDFAGDLSVIDIDTTASAENDGIHIKTDADAVTTANIIYNALTSVVSTLTLTATGYPDGTYSAEFYKATSPLTHIKTENVTFASGSSSVIMPTIANTTVYTRIDGSTPPSTGVTCYGVTV